MRSMGEEMEGGFAWARKPTRFPESHGRLRGKLFLFPPIVVKA